MKERYVPYELSKGTIEIDQQRIIYMNRCYIIMTGNGNEVQSGFLIPVGEKNRNPPIKPIYREYRDFLFLFFIFLFFIYFLIYFLV